MTKLTKQKLPKSRMRGGPGMYHCETCRQWVPSKEKHNNKHHKIEEN